MEKEKELILKFKRKDRYKEIVLLFLAMSIKFKVNDLEKTIIVESEDRKKALYQIYLYRKENQRIPEKVFVEKFNYAAYYSVILVFFSFYLFQMVERIFIGNLNILNYGSLNVDLVRKGEWYRLITALTLHGDFVHILSNAFFGGFIFYFLLKRIGVGLGWLFILFSGIIGNFFSAIVEPSGFISIGSSTACFGGLGILTSLKIFGKDINFLGARFSPLMASLALLGMFGTSPYTDIFGHLFGFLSGILVGFFYNIFVGRLRLINTKFFQLISGLVAFFVLVFSWLIALKNLLPFFR